MPPRHNRPFQNRRQQIGGSETLPKNLDWLPSVSRSGGSGEGDGDSLKSFTVQETYRRWIDEKLLEYEKEGQIASPETAKLSREDILRRFRKLREGLMASNRDDAFATEVYEISLLLAAAYNVPDQVTAVAAHILPPSMIESSKLAASATQQLTVREITLFFILTHHLCLATRSSSSLQWIVTAVSHPLVVKNLSGTRLRWLKRVMLAWRCGNYHSVWSLTSKKSLDALLYDCLSPHSNGGREKAAFVAEVERFRHHVREVAWTVTRTAYREENESWLLHSLSLTREGVGWISNKQKLQEALLVPGDKPRWKLFKAKPST